MIIQRKTIVPPHSLVKAKIEFSHSSNKTYIIHGPEINHNGILITHSLVHQNDPTTKQGILCLRNESSSYIRLKRGHVVGRGEEVDPECIYPTSDNNLHVEADRCLLGNLHMEQSQEYISPTSDNINLHVEADRCLLGTSTWNNHKNVYLQRVTILTCMWRQTGDCWETSKWTKRKKITIHKLVRSHPARP